MQVLDRPTQPAVADRPVLRLLERPPRLQVHRAQPQALPVWWSRLERWAGALLR